MAGRHWLCVVLLSHFPLLSTWPCDVMKAAQGATAYRDGSVEGRHDGRDHSESACWWLFTGICLPRFLVLITHLLSQLLGTAVAVHKDFHAAAVGIRPPSPPSTSKLRHHLSSAFLPGAFILCPSYQLRFVVPGRSCQRTVALRPTASP